MRTSGECARFRMMPPRSRRERTRRTDRRNRFGLITDPKTSARLGRIRQRDTSAELIVRRALRAIGHQFRVKNRDLPGSPDIANRTKRWAIFVHGCFWHRHSGCSRATMPKRNREFWLSKFETNRARDRRVVIDLRALGFRTLTVWECEVESSLLRRRLKRKLPVHAAVGEPSRSPLNTR